MDIRFKELLHDLKNKGLTLKKDFNSLDLSKLLTDIDIYQAELIAQNEELLKKENENLELINKLNLFFMDAPIVYIVLDKNLNVSKFNNYATNYFDFSYNETIKSYFPNFIINNFRMEFLNWILDLSHDIKTITLDCLTKTNKTNRFQINVSIINDENDKYLIAMSSIQTEIDLINEIQNNEKNKFEQLTNFIDSISDIVVLTDSYKLKYANKKMFEFLGFKDIDDFFEKHNCICEFFEIDDEFFHLNKIDDSQNWIDEIKKLSSNERNVLIKSKNLNLHIFSVHVNEFSQKLFSVVFSDQTSSYKEKMNLMIKIHIDNLTKCYNRSYFEKLIPDLMENTSIKNENFTLTIIDVDFFKKVNDNHGHDIGDIVLVELCENIRNNIRKDDILIRWGGEEFILIIKNQNSISYMAILEHLKQSIQNHNFTKAGQVTCSFGGTFYKENEDIIDTIKRADKALYDSKNGGRNCITIR